MTTKLLLVDYENVQQLDFGLLGDAYNVIVFFGASQKSVPIDLVASAQKLGSRVVWQRVEGNGKKNALDFFIACELGRVRERAPGVHCTVLSKDQGFDPLLLHLNKNGLKCARINSMLELGPKATSKTEPDYTRVVELLRKTEDARPRTRLTLSKHISAMFQNGLPAADINRIIDLLFANKVITESNKRLTYEF